MKQQQPQQPACLVPAPWREFVAEVVASAESYERRTGQKVNAEWVSRGRALLAAELLGHTPMDCAAAQRAGEEAMKKVFGDDTCAS